MPEKLYSYISGTQQYNLITQLAKQLLNFIKTRNRQPNFFHQKTAQMFVRREEQYSKHHYALGIIEAEM